jgi:hypothetical protein
MPTRLDTLAVMAKHDVTAEDVEAAIAEYDLLGQTPSGPPA